MQVFRSATLRIPGLKLQPVIIQLVEDRTFASNATSSETSRHFKYDDLELHTSKNPQKKPDLSSLVFGKNFSDHMLDIPWSETKGWGVPRIGPIRNIELHPAAKVLHYAMELFEGMKAYYGVDGKVRLFRPEKNMERMLTTANRASLPEFDANEFIRCIAQLVDMDRSWVPQNNSSSLYIRPTFIGTEPTLGVARSKEALLYVITGPVGPYFPTGLKPVSLLADPKFVRSWHGGAGSFKMGSNYAPTIAIQNEAEKKGCQQVLWLHGEDHNLTEVGAMNIMVFWTNENGEKELVTPPLDGLILPGITRLSVLDLARIWGDFKVTEKPIPMRDVLKAVQEKRLIELFGCGTACLVCPVFKIFYDNKDIMLPVPDEKISLSGRLYKELRDIQYGRNKNSWAIDIDELIAAVPKNQRIKACAINWTRICLLSLNCWLCD